MKDFRETLNEQTRITKEGHLYLPLGNPPKLHIISPFLCPYCGYKTLFKKAEVYENPREFKLWWSILVQCDCICLFIDLGVDFYDYSPEEVRDNILNKFLKEALNKHRSQNSKPLMDAKNTLTSSYFEEFTRTYRVGERRWKTSSY